MIWLVRLILILSPAYNLYIFMTAGVGAEKGEGWLQENLGKIAWTLGPYVVILLYTFFAGIRSAGQKVMLLLGTLAVAYFFFEPNIYQQFIDMPFFAEENRILLPTIPYVLAFTVLILAELAKLFSGNKPKPA